MQPDEAHRLFAKRINGLVEREIAPIALAVESTSAFPRQAYDILAREKLFALALPRAHGGAEADATTLALMVEGISRVSPSSALLVFPSNAVLRTIAMTANQAQQRRLFGELSAGRTPMAFCLTEPECGSDAARLRTRAKDDGDRYLVSGTKSFITLGPHAGYYLTFVRTGDDEGAAGISALLVPRDAPGLTFGEPEKKMGLHGSVTCQMYLDQVPVSKELRLWGEGEGWRLLTEVANPMRVWGAAAMALGVAQGLLDQALAHALETRDARGRPLMASQDVAFACADMKIAVEACRSLVYRVCGMLDRGQGSGRELDGWVSMAKCLAADTAVRLGELASRVMGPAMGSADSLAGRLFCSAKAIQIFDGSNQVQRMVVSRNLARQGR